MIAIVPIIMSVLGCLIYGLGSNPKVAELGRLLAMAGFIGLAIAYGGHLIGFGVH